MGTEQEWDNNQYANRSSTYSGMLNYFDSHLADLEVTAMSEVGHMHLDDRCCASTGVATTLAATYNIYYV